MEDQTLFEGLKAIIETAEGDADKFYAKGNKAAGTRLRKAMQDVKKAAQDVRLDVQSKKTA